MMIVKYTIQKGADLINIRERLAKDLLVSFKQDVMSKEKAEIELHCDEMVFVLSYPQTEKKVHTLRLTLHNNTLFDMKPGQWYGIVPFMRVLVMELRKNMPYGIYSVELRNECRTSSC